VSFSPELDSALEQMYEVLQADKTVVLIMEDMVDINDHFQAVLDWLKDEKGLKMKRRHGACCFMQTGVLYFVGADVHRVPTRGVEKELDIRAYTSELIRTSGLEARLRAKQEA